ncbi:reductase [Exophiala viscosa]|uniref:Reductase n=1 Tax=Exophiala viscosa TaxID=2486360 RepID=A0AAN6I7W7_9EURO|nr:reductase [Exophiala viscosa]KAI1628495.1 reductase [Exophiala viscosa]
MQSTTAMTATHHIPTTSHSHPNDPIPEDPTRKLSMSVSQVSQSPVSTATIGTYSDDGSSIDTTPTTPSDHLSEDSYDEEQSRKASNDQHKKRRASTVLVSEDSEDARRFLGEAGTATSMIQKACCGGGCCMLQEFKSKNASQGTIPVGEPQTPAYKSLKLKLGLLGLDSELTGIVDMPPKTVSLEPLSTSPSTTYAAPTKRPSTEVLRNPPNFVTPHPPYQVYAAPLFHARELTKPGAEKRTYHFDIDVTDYPTEGGDVDFVVGGAIGVCAPNPTHMVDQIFDRLGVPSFVRDKPVLLKTTSGRWPTIWGDETSRELVTTRRELLTWCSDIQSYAPTKQLFRMFAEFAEDEHEKKILMYLSSAQGQGTFCDLRTGPYTTIPQLMDAFQSSRPPLDYLLSVLNQLMPRFYSLSQDPQVSCLRDGTDCRKLIEIAVTVHEAEDYATGKRTGVGSGFLERLARQLLNAEKEGKDPSTLDLRVPIFRGLMANPLAREFVSDGPMLLIGAGVGIAPFRGFVHRRLKSANCANKVWVLQGIRDSLVDELYSGDWGVHEDQVKKVVQSRKGKGRYVQEEVRHQADLVWFIINALDGRIFVCGSSKGMGEGVEEALIDVAVAKGKLNHDEAKSFWAEKKASGQYIAETW